MNIAYFEPFSRAFSRMKIALFKPFDLHKWFIIGFNAFLAGLIGGPRSSGSSGWRGDTSFREFLGFPNKAWEWLMSHPGWFVGIVFIGIFLIILGVILTWLSSRGTFMFLDSVVHDRAEIAKPWKRYRLEGNSLFLWRLVFILICIILFTSYIIFFFTTASHLYSGSYYERAPVFLMVVMSFLFILTAAVIGFISMFLNSFVAPIMYKNSIKATQAWSRFLSLFKRHPFHFILFGLILFVLAILSVIFVAVAGLLTCCVGFLLLIIPYIGTVFTLPIWYTFRAFSLEFLAQFGPEYELFPPSGESSASAPV
jgi:MFS family permease